MPRHYSAKTKAQAVGIAEVEGQTEAARKTGIPLTTINQWFHRPEFVELRTTKREDVEEQFWAGIQVGLKAVVQGLGEPARLSEKAIALGVLYDKHALLTGNATSRTEAVSITDGLSLNEKRALRARLDRAVRGESDADRDGGEPVGTGQGVAGTGEDGTT